MRKLPYLLVTGHWSLAFVLRPSSFVLRQYWHRTCNFAGQSGASLPALLPIRAYNAMGYEEV